MDLIAVVLLFAFVALFAVRAWKARGRLSAPDRWALITSLAVAVTMFALARLLVNWVMLPTVVWLGAVILLAGGVVGAVLRWPELAWLAGRHPLRRALGAGATLVACVLVIGLAVL
jgi:hypothetical protein